MKTIWLIAGHSDTDSGAVAHGVKEADLTKELRELVKAGLTDKLVKTDFDKDRLAAVVTKIKEESDWDDVILDLHFNAASGTATGVEAFVPKDANDKEKQLATKLCSAVCTVLEIKNRGVKSEENSARRTLAIMRPRGVNVLLEVCFMDNKEELLKYQSKKKEVAKAIVSILSSC